MPAIERDVGSLFVVGFPGRDVPHDLARAIERSEVGGVILFSRNFDTVDDCRELCRKLRALSPGLLVAIDQEGGRVQRLRAPFPELPPMRGLGRAGRLDLAHRAGELLGDALADLGIHQDYAPVLDVDSNPDNPVIGDRAFAAEPEPVAALGCAFIDGLQSRGVAACAKHFPGHGDTHNDSHHVLPRVDADEGTLRTRELVPFGAAIASGVSAVMTAHVVYPALDPDEPATFSSKILGPELRERLGFGGLAVSDDLEMGAVERSIPEAAVAALGAGCDQLLVCSRPDDARAAREAVVDAARSGLLPELRWAEAVRRVARHRARFARAPVPADRDDLRRRRDALLADLDGASS